MIYKTLDLRTKTLFVLYMVAWLSCLHYIIFTNTPYVLFQISLVLCSISVISLIFLQKNKSLILFLLISFIFLNRYIFAFRFNYPIGTDMPFHYMILRNILDANFHVNFNELNTVSNSHPLLYVLYLIIEIISGVGFDALIKYIPPSINMLRFLFYFLFISFVVKNSPYKDKKNVHVITALSTLILGWNYHVFLFGFEFRTESLAVVFVSAILYLIMKKHTIQNSSLLILFVLSTILTHIVSSTHLILILFLIVLATILITTNGKSDMVDAGRLMLLSSVFFFAFMLFQTKNINYLIPLLIDRLDVSYLQQYNPATDAGVVSAYYGMIPSIGEWGSRIFFICGIVLYSLRSIKSTKSTSGNFLILSAVIYIGVLLFAMFTSILSAGRIFNYLGITYAFFIAVVLFEISQFKIKNKEKYVKVIRYSIISIILLLYIFVLINKLPYWAIDPSNTHSRGGVDDFHYELYDFDKSAVAFYESHVSMKEVIGNQNTQIRFNTFSDIKVMRVQNQINDASIQQLAVRNTYIMLQADDAIRMDVTSSSYSKLSNVYHNGHIIYTGVIS